MLRPVDTVLFALSRYRPWARERMVYRALVVLTAESCLPQIGNPPKRISGRGSRGRLPRALERR